MKHDIQPDAIVFPWHPMTTLLSLWLSYPHLAFSGEHKPHHKHWHTVYGLCDVLWPGPNQKDPCTPFTYMG